MGLAITDADLAHLQSTYPALDIRPLTGQQELFLMHILKGHSVVAAERAAGYAKGSGNALLKLDHVQVILDYFRTEVLTDVSITRDLLTQMLVEAHSHAGCATEEIMAIKELGKMHDLYEDAKHKGTKIHIGDVNTQNNSVQNMKQIERLTDDELLALAGGSALLPEPKVEERVPVLIEQETPVTVARAEDRDESG